MVVKVLSHMTTNNTKEYETFKKMVSNESCFFFVQMANQLSKSTSLT